MPETKVTISTMVSFSKKYSKGVLARENDPMVIKVYIKYLSVKRVLIDSAVRPMSYTGNGCLKDAAIQDNTHRLLSRASAGAWSHVSHNCVWNWTRRQMSKSKISHCECDLPIQHNHRKANFNTLEASLSTLYLTMKYPLSNREVGVVKGDQGLAYKCYKVSLKLKKKTLGPSREVNLLNVDMIDLDPREDLAPDNLMPIGEVKIIKIDPVHSK